MPRCCCRSPRCSFSVFYSESENVNVLTVKSANYGGKGWRAARARIPWHGAKLRLVRGHLGQLPLVVAQRRAMLTLVHVGADLYYRRPDVRIAFRHIGVAARPGTQRGRAQVDQVLQMLLPHRLLSPPKCPRQFHRTALQFNNRSKLAYLLVVSRQKTERLPHVVGGGRGSCRARRRRRGGRSR